MRKKLLALIMSLAFILATPSSAQASSMHMGEHGKVVIQFQLQHHLKPDGIVGPITLTTSIISEAKSHLGLHYVWGGTSPVSGFDCSGFVQYVFKQNGITLPRVSRDQSTVGTVISYEKLHPGDLLFFSMYGNGISHVGIYLGNGQFIGSESAGVRVVTITQYWKLRFVTARRVY